MTRARLVWLGFGLAALVVIGVEAGWSWVDSDPAGVVTQAQADYQAARYEAAAAGLARLVRLRTPTPMDRMARALVARARGQDALVELAQIPRDDLLSPQANLLAGQIELDHRRLRRAEAYFLATLTREPNDAHARRELAYIYNVQRRLHEMDEQMDALSGLNALGFDHVLHWSKTRNVAWNPSSDCDSLANYLAADPDDRYSRLALVDGLRQLGRLDLACSILAFLPDSDVEGRARRVLLALDRGDRDRADLLLSSGPIDHPGLAAVRGQLALCRGDPRGAVHFLRIAAAAHPDDLATVSALATAQRLSDNAAGAQACLDVARRHAALTALITLAATPVGRSDPALPARLGVACEAAGRLALARAWYRLAIASDPLDTASQQALFRLRNGALGRAPTVAAAHRGRPVGPTAELREGQ